MNHKIWIIHVASENYRIFKARKPVRNLIDLVDMFKSGVVIGKQWETIEMEFYEGDKGKAKKEKEKPIADFIQGVVVEAVSFKARSLIEPLTNNKVEFLPLKTDLGYYYEMNIKYVDCLNVSNSVVQRFESSGRIMRVLKYWFDLEKLGESHIFRIPELGTSLTFVSDLFKSTIEKNELTGLSFESAPLANHN